MQSTSRLTTTRPGHDDEQPTPPEQRPLWRIWTIVGVFGIVAVVLIAQLLRYQFFPPQVPEVAAAKAVISDARGTVVDRNGTPLVVNRHFFQLTITPANIKTPEERHEIAQQLMDLIGLPYDQTFSTLTDNTDAQFAVLADAITLDKARLVLDYQRQLAEERLIFPLQHVQAVSMTRRYYPQMQLTSHLLGFVRPYHGGVTGIEEYYNDFLLQDGTGLLTKNVAAIDSLSPDVLRFVPSPVGKDLVLTIDTTIQWILREELQKGLEEYQAKGGSAIAMNPHTGAILGMVSLPDYDPNSYEETAFELFPNPVISAQYEPGSIFKIVTVAAALDAGEITPTTIFTDSGSIAVGGRVIFNSNRMGHGPVPVTEALARSLNVVTAQIAQEMGPEEFYRYLRLFGFGEATGVDLSGEINGLIKTPANANWSMADLGTNSFGQGLAVTPLQMLNATAVIANGGKLMRPYVVESRIGNSAVQFTQPVIVRQVLQPETAAQMADMMVEVVDTGNTRAAVENYRVAGKSGTAQIPTLGGYEKEDTIASFVGFAPADDPAFVLLVKMDRPDPSINSWASQTAAPVFSRMSERLLNYLTVLPDDQRLASGFPAGE